tara:strand:+ start:1066 stop:1224 length:159 start_codon:yes stop_codon:yes gene_type:complete
MSLIKYIFNNGTYQVNYSTDETSKPHLTMDEFDLFSKEAIRKHILYKSFKIK